jgi:DNA-binding XRE family transcriptional regulator
LLRNFRRKFGLQQKVFADMANVSEDSVYRAEAGWHVYLNTARLLARALRVDLQELILDSDRSEVEPSKDEPAIERLVEDALLPAIYGALRRGDLKSAEDWLARACRLASGNARDRLRIDELCFYRISGKRGVARSLEELSRSASRYADRARVELMLVHFANVRSPMTSEPCDLGQQHLRRLACAVLGLESISSGDLENARRFWSLVGSVPSSNTAEDVHTALMLGVLCFALNESEAGEQYFDLARSDPEPDDPELGYPFHFLLRRIDKAFINACIVGSSGLTLKGDDAERLREPGSTEDSETAENADQFRRSGKPDPSLQAVRGHVWVVSRTAEIMLNSKTATASFSHMTRRWSTAERWTTPAAVSDRLRTFVTELRKGISGAHPLS